MLPQAETLDGADEPDSPSKSSSSSPDASPESDSSSEPAQGPSFSQAQATGDFQALGAEQAKSKKKRIPLRECVTQPPSLLPPGTEAAHHLALWGVGSHALLEEYNIASQA